MSVVDEFKPLLDVLAKRFYEMDELTYQAREKVDEWLQENKNGVNNQEYLSMYELAVALTEVNESVTSGFELITEGMLEIDERKKMGYLKNIKD